MSVGANVSCDDGDLALAGAHSGTARDTQVTGEFFSSAAGFQDFWGLNFKNFSTQDDPVRLSVNCVDLPPMR